MAPGGVLATVGGLWGRRRVPVPGASGGPACWCGTGMVRGRPASSVPSCTEVGSPGSSGCAVRLWSPEARTRWSWVEWELEAHLSWLRRPEALVGTPVWRAERGLPCPPVAGGLCWGDDCGTGLVLLGGMVRGAVRRGKTLTVVFVDLARGTCLRRWPGPSRWVLDGQGREPPSLGGVPVSRWSRDRGRGCGGSSLGSSGGRPCCVRLRGAGCSRCPGPGG